MEVKLIPVIELFFSGIDQVEAPKQGPYWKHRDEYDLYNQQCLNYYGYDLMTPVEKGSMLFPLDGFTSNNIQKVVSKHFSDLELSQFDEDELSSIGGGYVLSLKGKHKLFPQCCGSLSDISCWMDLANGNPDALSMMSSHPAPKAVFEGDYIIIDLSKTNSGEKFSPEPEEFQIRFKKQDLQQALNEVYAQLDKLADELKILNEEYGLDDESDLLWKKLIFDESE